MNERQPVLIAFNDLTEFYAIQPDIDIMVKRKIPISVFVMSSYSEKMYESTKSTIKNLGYNVVDGMDDRYKVLLEPYPLLNDVRADFRIKYQYGLTAASLKPNPVYTPEWNLPYDAIACYSFIEESVFSVYAKPYLIKPLQFNNFELHKHGKKLNVLVLFTWGDTTSTQKLLKIKQQLGSNYNLIVKAHHAVQYRPDHKGITEELKSIADEYYDATTDVNVLFRQADIVLSDNSSAIFTAIYLGIPTAIFTEAASDAHSLNGMKAAHFALLIEPGHIPYTSKLEEVRGIVDHAFKNIHQQNKLKGELYPYDITQTLADVVEKYFYMNRSEEPYYIIRDFLRERESVTQATLQQQASIINNLNNQVELLQNQLASFTGVKRSVKLLSGNIKRKVKISVKRK